MNLTRHASGAVLRAAELGYRQCGDCWVSRMVGPEIGATFASVDAVKIPPGRQWAPPDAQGAEQVAVVLSGSGVGTVDFEISPMRGASALYSPTGSTYSVSAGDREMTVYVWTSVLPEGARRGTRPARFRSLWNSETRLAGLPGIGRAPRRTAATNVLFWPGAGSARLCLHCVIMMPEETLAVHTHPGSDEAYFVFEGSGQFYLDDRWVDLGPGDGVFAPPDVPHGARNPYSGHRADRFVAFGGPAPFDPELYGVAGVSAEVR
ncbi:cupin domain-containing protein [Microbispora sp. ATCC PTA-5024]|uniref:cupin domain-containing protein n=1 Tax=Microbispora sp. ATCC PTA-5024 TaxID=316330 RepID=UPI000402E830|nr:cupin domain-containing protein [Microbispora sp. ATCC PTA-5024]